MTAVVEGAVSAEQCDLEEARALTDQIKAAAEKVWSLLLTAHERRAWVALGYDTWSDYVGSEFDMSRSQSYYLIDQAKAIQQISAVVPVSTNVDINQGQARAIKPVLAEVTDNIEQRMAKIRAAQAAEPAQELIDKVVAEEVERGRKLAEDMAARAKRADPAMANVLAAVPPDYDPVDDEARLDALGALIHGVEEIAALSYEPSDLGAWAHHTTLYHFAGIRSVVAFLSSFADAVEARA